MDVVIDTSHLQNVIQDLQAGKPTLPMERAPAAKKMTKEDPSPSRSTKHATSDSTSPANRLGESSQGLSDVVASSSQRSRQVKSTLDGWKDQQQKKKSDTSAARAMDLDHEAEQARLAKSKEEVQVAKKSSMHDKSWNRTQSPISPRSPRGNHNAVPVDLQTFTGLVPAMPWQKLGTWRCMLVKSFSKGITKEDITLPTRSSRELRRVVYACRLTHSPDMIYSCVFVTMETARRLSQGCVDMRSDAMLLTMEMELGLTVTDSAHKVWLRVPFGKHAGAVAYGQNIEAVVKDWELVIFAK